MKQTRKTEAQGRFARQLIRWQEITLAIAVAAVCIGFFLLRGGRASGGVRAVVYIDSTQAMDIALNRDDDYHIHLEAEYGLPVSFHVSEGKICFEQVTCPDHLCEKTGYIYTEGQTAVCMPNKVAVVIK